MSFHLHRIHFCTLCYRYHRLNIWYFSFRDWLISLRITFPSFIPFCCKQHPPWILKDHCIWTDVNPCQAFDSWNSVSLKHTIFSGRPGKLKFQPRVAVWVQTLFSPFFHLISQSLISQLTAWGPSILWRIICFIQLYILVSSQIYYYVKF